MRAVPTSIVFVTVVLTSGAAPEAQVLDRIYAGQLETMHHYSNTPPPPVEAPLD